MALTAGVFTYGTDDQMYGPAVGCTLVAVLIMFVRAFRAGTLVMPVSASVVSLLAFFGYLLVSVTWSSMMYTSVYFILIFMIMPLLFMAVVFNRRAEEILPFAMAGVGAVMATVMIWALVQYIFMFGGDFGTRVKHPFLDPNNLAVFMNMALLPLLALSFRAQVRREQIMYGVLTLLFFIALLATNSRMALLAAIVGFLVLLPVLIRSSKHPTLLTLALFVGAGFVIVAMNFAMDGVLFFYMREIFNFEKSASMYDRLALWMSSLRIFKDHFWLGTGLATFYFYYPQYRQPNDTSDGYFAHMDPLQIGLETGIFGYILLYAFLICMLCRTIRVVRLSHLTARDRLLVLAPFTGLLSVCIHMHMTFCLYLPAIAIPVGVLLAWWYVMTQRYLTDRQIELSSRAGRMVSITGIVFIVAGLVWSVQAAAGIYLNGNAAVAIAEGQFNRAQSLIEWEYTFSPHSSYRPYEREADMAFQKLRQMQRVPTVDRTELLEQGVAAIDEAIARQPRHGSLRNLKAMLLYVAGEEAHPGAIDEAIALLYHVLRLDPMMTESRTGLAIILRERGEFERATRLMEEGLRWPRPRGMTDVNYIVMTANFNELAGHKERHDLLMRYAAERARLYGFEVTNSAP